MDCNRAHPLCQLTDEEKDLVLQLTLTSGSLKAMARYYGVSYPTIRARLDRLIARLTALAEGRAADPMAHFLADLVETGRLSGTTARHILRLHKDLCQKSEGR